MKTTFITFSVLLLCIYFGYSVRIPLAHIPTRSVRSTSDGGEHLLQDTTEHLTNYVKTKFKSSQGSRSRADNIPVNGNISQGEYYATLFLGSPPSPFVVQLDTGSSFTAVAQYGCSNCSAAPNKYNPSISTTSTPMACDSKLCTAQVCYSKRGNCGFYCQYGDGSTIAGSVSEDEAIFGDFKLALPFGGILESDSFFQNPNVAGIMGLAYPPLGCVPSCITPIFDLIVSEFNITDQFALYLDNSDNSYMEFGTLNTTGTLYTPILEDPDVGHTFYNISFDSIEIFGNTLGSSTQDVESAIVDSGTTLWIVPNALLDQIKNTLTSCNEDIFGICRSQQNIFTHSFDRDMFYSRTSNLADYPNIYLRVGEIELTIPPTNYFLESDGQIYFGIANADSNLMILGNVVMKEYLVTFDRGNQRVGWQRDGFVVAHSDTGGSVTLKPWLNLF
eukprot:TRINITY_DN1317_c0_g1_i1.p1 TRINITY_DN1317_c0_g1~~TRINITY_DN1317_c0_g1_i1.p1  ORF type:complete len:446 (+),score=70.82 TRINITY_DN1317_c0_g1_i1:48-1385(+)